MVTALDLIKEAGKEIGIFSVGYTPSAEEASDALTKLNYVVDDFNTQNLALYNTLNVVSTLTASKNPHTLGVGGDIDIARPVKIQRCFVRALNAISPVDYELKQIDNDQYQEIVTKSIGTTYPTHFYYDLGYPLANFYTYPVQNATLELHLSVWTKIDKFTLTTVVDLPEGYRELLMLKLALKLCPSYNIPTAKIATINNEFSRIMRNIKAINQDSNHVNLDSILVHNAAGRFNILKGFR